MGELDCYYDLNEWDAELEDPLEELEQDVYHMLIESYGSNLDAPDRGIGIEDALSGFVDDGLAQRIEAQLRDDDRIESVEVRVSRTDGQASPQAGATFRIEIDIEANGEALDLVFDFITGKGLQRVA